VKLPPPKQALADSDGFIIEPVPHPHMVITEPLLIGDGAILAREFAAQGSLHIGGSGSKASSRSTSQFFGVIRVAPQHSVLPANRG
jgi:hypothetical protein